ncbi:MAG: cation diffusion facilitator family transporter [Cycloclasticus sp.]|nr:cation diffusion facilitator family transporter [Cycloclasticus sp.]
MEHHHHGAVKNIKLAFFLNLSFTIIEFIGGALTNSTAILADAVHDLGDSIALGQAWYFESLTHKNGSKRYTFGYKRFTVVGALVSTLILIVSSAYVLTEAIPRLLNPQQANAEGMLLLAVLGVAVNSIAVFRLSKDTGINARVVKLHLLEDALGWVAVLVVAIVLMFKDIPILDPILAILITLYILTGVVKNLKKVITILLQATPDKINIEQLEGDIKALKQVKDAHHLHIWSLDGEEHVLTIHLVVRNKLNPSEYAELKQQVKSIIRSEGVFHSTIEIEWPGELCGIDDTGHNRCRQ